MIKIRKFTVEYLENNCVTDNKKPRFSYVLECDENGIDLNKFEEGIGDWYDDFVDRWAGIKESYSDDPDYKYQNDIDDMNWEDMFDFYGIQYHR